MPFFSCTAIIFDMDGVLVDSEPLAIRQWTEWGEENGVDPSEILAVHHGRPLRETIQIVAPHLKAIEHAKELGLRFEAQMEGLSAYPGVAQLLPTLPTDRWAVATSAPRILAEPRFEFLGLTQPRVIVTSDDVTRGKPDPEPYKLAAESIGVTPSDCVVIEDAPAGIASAKAAGARVVAVATTNSKSVLGQADVIVDSFASFRVVESDGLEIHW